MADDFFAPHFPDDPVVAPQGRIEPEAAGPGSTQIMVRDRNMGAVRVAQPRSMGRVMATIQQQVEYFGQRFEYSIPFKDRRKGIVTHVTGPTIVCATAVARAYGNCTVGCSVTQESASHWVMDAWFNDVEAGMQLIRPFRQRKVQDVGGYGGDSGRAEDIIFQIAASKAIRNVTVNALRDLIEDALYQARNRLTERCEKNPDKAREWIRQHLAEYEISEEVVARSMGRSIDKMRAHHLAQVMRLLMSVKESTIDANEAFPAAEHRPDAGSGGDEPSREAEATTRTAATGGHATGQAGSEPSKPKTAEPDQGATTTEAEAKPKPRSRAKVEPGARSGTAASAAGDEGQGQEGAGDQGGEPAKPAQAPVTASTAARQISFDE